MSQDFDHAFELDERLASSCFDLVDWPLSRVLLKNNANYPWLILVPRRRDITEINQLSREDRHQLMDEIAALSSMVENQFNPHKLNIGALGNIVAQLHVHVVARFSHDHSWPCAVWHNNHPELPYVDPESLISDLKKQLSG